MRRAHEPAYRGETPTEASRGAEPAALPLTDIDIVIDRVGLTRRELEDHLEAGVPGITPEVAGRGAQSA